MITNKDVRVENGNLVLNGDKYPLDGQSPEAIMQIVEDNSDTTPTENSDAPITSGGVYTAINAVDSKFTNLPTAMETGKAQFPAAAIGAQDIEVPFTPGLFTSAPVVTATMSDTTPFNVGTYMEADLYVYNVTKDSFFLRGTRKNASYSWYANWIAVEM